MSGEHLDHIAKTSWSLEQAKVPESTASATGQPIGINAAIARFDGFGLAAGYTVALPTKPTGVYSGSVYPDDLSKQRVVHLDQYSGEPLIDMSYTDYGPLGKALEWGSTSIWASNSASPTRSYCWQRVSASSCLPFPPASCGGNAARRFARRATIAAG